MKKSFIIIAAAALVMSACVENDTFRKEVVNNGENNGAIGFTSFTEKVTKAENSEGLYTWTFFDHQESFLVWARKNNQPTNNIFDDNGTKVTVTKDGEAYKYTYAPDRYWDKIADSYHFYAAAPAPAEGSAWSWKFIDDNITSSDNIDKGYFKIEDNKFSLNGVNLQSVENAPAAQAELKNSFKTAVKGSAKDIDLLIAAPCKVENSYYNKANPDAVNLNFIHILSKLNITISTALPTSGDNAHVVNLLAFEVKNVPNTGSFDESSKELTTNNKQIRWTLKSGETTDILTGIEAYDAATYTIDATKKVDVPFTSTAAPAKKYIVESLIIPQPINYERVALDAKAHDAVNTPATYYTSWEEYTQAKPIEEITEAEFNTIKDALDAGTATDEQKAKIEKTPAINIAAFAVPTQPYFSITYSIDDEVFIANYNLAAAFMNYNNNNQKWATDQYVDLTATDATTFDFYEGWQNTLNIIINPTSAAIQFTADVAEWSDNANASYEIEKGNE